MALIGQIKPTPFETGLKTDVIKPITESGLEVTQVDDSTSNGLWGFLDNIVTPIQNGLGLAVTGLVDRELTKQGFNDNRTIKSTGDPDDKAGNTLASQASSFIEKNKTALMVAGGLAVVGLVILAVKK